MKTRVFVSLLVLGCAPGAGSAPAPADSADAAIAQEGRCNRRGTVRVHVDNTGSTDIEVTFGSYTPARAALGFSQTTYDVPRAHLQRTIRLRIVRGGLHIGAPASIATEPVVCNDATLIIGGEPNSSFFYGDRFGGAPADSNTVVARGGSLAFDLGARTAGVWVLAPPDRATATRDSMPR